jgi:site-specific DNA recombinase
VVTRIDGIDVYLKEVVMMKRQFTPMPDQKRVAIYCRVSTARQEDEGTSLGSQEAACRAYAAEQGYTVAAVYRETHSGADLFERPLLSELRESVRHGDVGTVIAHALDRLSRNQAHLGLILSEAEHAGVTVEFVTEKLEDTPEGRLLQSVRGFVAEVERLKIGERSSRGRRSRAENGKPIPGWKAPYGYMWADPAKGAKTRLIVKEDEAPIVRRIFADMAAGKSIRRIASELTADGIPSPSGNARWGTSTIPEIVKSPVYVGELRSFRHKCEKTRGKRRMVTVNAEVDQVTMPVGTAPALVAPELREAALARLARNKAESARRNPDPESTLLRVGFARCGYCGSPLQGFKRPDGGRGYRCNYSVAQRAKTCPSFAISASLLDQAVWARVEAVLLRPAIIAAEVARQRGASPAAGDLTALEVRIAELHARRQRAARFVVTMDDDDAAAPLIAEMTALANQTRALEAERAALIALHEGWEADQARLADLATWCDHVAGNLPTLTYAAERDALAALGVQVSVWRTDHSPRWEMTMRLDDLLTPGAPGAPDTLLSGTPRCLDTARLES